MIELIGLVEWVLKAIWAALCFLFEVMGEFLLTEGLTAFSERPKKPEAQVDTGTMGSGE